MRATTKSALLEGQDQPSTPFRINICAHTYSMVSRLGFLSHSWADERYDPPPYFSGHELSSATMAMAHVLRTSDVGD